MTMGDPMDQPEEEGMSLVFPFVVCQSNGGPYDDDAFTAGYQCGQIDRSLAAAAAVGATSMTCTVYTTLIKQLELVAMNRGFSNVDAQECEPTPEWSFITFTVEGDEDHGLPA